MMMYKLFSFSFVFLTPIFAYILVTFFKLKRFGILFTDIAFPIFAFPIWERQYHWKSLSPQPAGSLKI